MSGGITTDVLVTGGTVEGDVLVVVVSCSGSVVVGNVVEDAGASVVGGTVVCGIVVRGIDVVVDSTVVVVSTTVVVVDSVVVVG